MKARLLILVGLVVLLVPTMVRHFLLWPFLGSQKLDSLPLVYAMGVWLPGAQIVGALLLAAGIFSLWRAAPGRRSAWWIVASLLLPVALFVAMGRSTAAAIFAPQFEPRFAQGTSEELPPETLVMGLRLGDEARAYPLRLLAYHHQVRDEIAGEPLLVTYCSMCRTGKIFRPMVDEQPLEFEVVGAVRYNSVYRDAQTGSYWFQANGKAVAGPLAGKVLPELRSDLTTLEQWLTLYPESQVLQPDPKHAEGYTKFGFDKYDEKRNDPEKDAEWQWVVGVVHGGEARGYAWSWLAGERLLQDELGDLPLAIHLLADEISHRVWDRRLGGRVLDLRLDEENDQLVDDVSGSSFGFDGVAQGGELAGENLRPVPSTVEFRHSFERFSEAQISEPPADWEPSYPVASPEEAEEPPTTNEPSEAEATSSASSPPESPSAGPAVDP